MAREMVSPDTRAVHAPQNGKQSSKFATNDLAVSRNRFRVLTLASVVVSLFFQTVAWVSPGWIIVTNRNEALDITTTVYQSVYYITTCIQIADDDVCEAVSLLTRYRDSVTDKSSDAAKIRLLYTYNKAVHLQLDVQFAWLLTLAVVIFHLFKILKGKAFPRASLLAAIILGASCVMMYTKLFDAFIEIDFMRRLVEVRREDDDSIGIGFPYSVFFYCFGLMTCAMACFLCCKNVSDYIRECSMKHETEEVRRERERRLKEWYEEELNKRIQMSRSNPTPSPRSSPRPQSQSRYDYDRPYDDKRERRHGHDERDSRRTEDVHLRVPSSGGPASGNDHGGNHFNFDAQKRSPRGSPRGSPRNSREVRDRDSHSPRDHHHGHHHRPHARYERAERSHSPRNGHHHDDRRPERSPRPDDHPNREQDDHHRPEHRRRHEATHREHPEHADRRDHPERTNRRRSPPRDEHSSSSSERSKQEYELVATHSDVDDTSAKDPAGSDVAGEEVTATSNIDTAVAETREGDANEIITI